MSLLTSKRKVIHLKQLSQTPPPESSSGSPAFSKGWSRTTTTGPRHQEVSTGDLRLGIAMWLAYTESNGVTQTATETATSLQISPWSMAAARRRATQNMVQNELIKTDWSIPVCAEPAKSWAQYLQQWVLTCVDWWDQRLVNDQWSMSVRIQKKDLHRWLTTDAPFTIALGADQAAAHRVTWDSDVTSLQAAKKRYHDTPGYEGVTYEVRGLPLHIGEGALETMDIVSVLRAPLRHPAFRSGG